MATAEFLFEGPRQALANRLEALGALCRRAYVVTGFATPDGLNSLPSCFRTREQLHTFVVGAATQRAFDALDALVAAGLPRERLRVHLGHTRLTKENATHRFLRYHPMLHGKIYLFEYDDATFAAVVGSHNVTNFALNGLNGEAAVCLRGSMSDPSYKALCRHIEACKDEAVPYDAQMKDAYAWWTAQFLQGMAAKVMDRERDVAREHILLLFCQGSTSPKPRSKLYLEVPAKLYQRNLRIKVHGYIFEQLPANTSAALELAASARATFSGTLDMIANKKSGAEVRADWELVGAQRELQRASKPFRPTVGSGMQQLLVEVGAPLRDQYHYGFDAKPAWLPVVDRSTPVSLPESDAIALEQLKLIPEEHLDWYPVSGLTPVRDEPNPLVQQAKREASARFVLLSTEQMVIEGGAT